MQKIRGDLTRTLLKELKNQLNNLEGVYLFGSRAQKVATKSSDWDFAFLSRDRIEGQILWDIKLRLESKFDTTLDIINLYKASTILQIQVIKTGELVWIGDINKIRQFEFLALSYYQKLNEERADIIRDIKIRGSVYG